MLRIARKIVIAVLAGACCPSVAGAQDLPRGAIIDDLRCVNDATQSYALYLPSSYSPDRTWSVLIGFHPGGRGRAIVEKYRAAAERYGYVVAASNNSRNGPWEVSMAAARAMLPDLAARFALDEKRIYLTGHSGGARVAMQIALASKGIAGVIASSGGYPDSQPRAKVHFAVFGTAGNEDFNYIEMRMLDRKLSSPHRLAVFDGGHTLPPDDVAMEAIEWMELQAMKAERRARDEGTIDAWLARRRTQIANAKSDTEAARLLQAVVEDFDGLRDEGADAAHAKDLLKRRDVKKALDRERDADTAEARMISELVALEAGLVDSDRRPSSLMALRDRLSKLAKQGNETAASPERSQARRVLRAVTAGAAGRVRDPEYRALLEQYRLRDR